MIYKGIVMSITPTYVAILTNDQMFLKIKKRDGLEVGQTILCLEEDLIVQERKVLSFKPKIHLLAVSVLAACLALFFIPKTETYAVLSVDINPSFEFKLDKNQKIIEVETFNQDAKNLSLDDLVGIPLEEGLVSLKDLLIEADYPLDEQSMLYSLTFMKSDNLIYENQVKEQLKSIQITTDFGYFKVTYEELKEANQRNMSAPRLKADAMLDRVNIDQLSVNEIMRLFQENCLQFDMMCHEGQEVQMKADCFP